MISLTVLFGLFVILFGVIGAMRGWAKELLVTSAVILGLFLNSILATYIQPYQTLMATAPLMTIFAVQAGAILLMAFFGYQTPKLQALQPKLIRERFEEILLGGFMGLLNGFLIVGSIWFYLHQTGYGMTDLVIAPEGELAEQIDNLMAYMPPSLLPIPHVFFAVGVVFVFIIVVFV